MLRLRLTPWRLINSKVGLYIIDKMEVEVKIPVILENLDFKLSHFDACLFILRF
jgi:hypothetical protein